jgi:large subunit ribosomal protein L6
MSRVGKHAIQLPNGVNVTLTSDEIKVAGKIGALAMKLSSEVIVKNENQQITVEPASGAKLSRMLWGTTQRLISNMVKGVSEGFTSRLEINGVGYRAQAQGKKLTLQLGFSHDINLDVPADISVTCEKPTLLVLSGPDKQRVGQFAALIKNYRPPEPYKGKGIRFENEFILRKEGKKK